MNIQLRKIISKISTNNFVYRIAQRIAYDHNGENNCDIDTNGELKVLNNYLKNANIVFDVGANVGDWAELALKIDPKIKVHCFEPCQKTFSQLLEKFNQNSSVVLNNVGLGLKKEKKIFYTSSQDSTVGSLYERNLGDSCKETVNLNSLDGYCFENNISQIDFLKIDVEGNEFDVLKGASKMLVGNKIKFIQFEYGGTYIDAEIWLKEVWQYFESLNYAWYKILPNNQLLVTEYNQSMDNFQYANYFLINKNS